MNISGPYRITHSHAIKKEKRVALFSVYCAESLNFILNMEADRKCKLTDMTSMTFFTFYSFTLLQDSFRSADGSENRRETNQKNDV